MRVAVLSLLVALTGCENPEEPRPAPRADDTTRVREVSSAAQGPLTLSIREVEQPGWTGRMVVVSLGAEGRQVRVLPSERPRPLAEIVARESPSQPFAAICGGFYDPSGAPMGLVRAGGVELHPLGESGGSGVFTVTPRALRIQRADAFRGSPSVTDALQSIDRLVAGGESLIGARASDRRAARSAVVLTRDGRLRLAIAFADDAVASEGDAVIALSAATASTGPTIAQWAELLRRDDASGGAGAIDALGLDGGHSTSLVVKSDARALNVIAANATINGVLVSFGGSPE